MVVGRPRCSQSINSIVYAAPTTIIVPEIVVVATVALASI